MCRGSNAGTAAGALITKLHVSSYHLADESHADLVATITNRDNRNAAPQSLVEDEVHAGSPDAVVATAHVAIDAIRVSADALGGEEQRRSKFVEQSGGRRWGGGRVGGKRP